jgi:hypothetical protein
MRESNHETLDSAMDFGRRGVSRCEEKERWGPQNWFSSAQYGTHVDQLWRVAVRSRDAGRGLRRGVAFNGIDLRGQPETRHSF